MDPLSITGTSIAIVQLVAQITKITRSYTKSVKGADETVKSFIAEIGSLAAVLDVLREDEEKNGGWREVRRKLGIQPSSGDGGEAEKTPNGAVVVVGTDGGEEAVKKNPNAAMSLLWTNLQECHREMREMLQKLEDGTKQKRGWWKKKMKLLMWPLEETEVEAWLAKVERWKATVSLALKVEDRNLQRRIATGIESIEQRKQESKEAKLKAKRQEKMQAVMAWLAPQDVEPKENHFASRRLQQKGTGKWFLDSAEFRDWKSKDSGLLWVCGGAGTGKSVLSSLIIDRLTTEAPSPEEAPIYFYIDFRNTAKTKVANIYRSLCVQLLSHFVDLPDELEARYDKQKMENLYEQELLDILHLLVEKAKTPTTVVIDALDECETRNDFMNAMVELPEKTRIRLLVTSRENVDIKHKFANQPTVQIRPELTKHDITLYVTEEVKRHARLGALSSDTREKVISTISSGADGMFQWAKLQIHHVGKQKTPKKLLNALQTLPPGLYATYERELAEIAGGDTDDKEMALRVLHWLTCSFREMLIKEIVEAIAIEEESPSLDQDDLIMSEEILIELCGSLVTVDKGKGTITLAHASVKEYLTSEAVKTSGMTEFYIPKETNYRLVRYCLTYICFDAFEAAELENLREIIHHHPFYAYASKYWMLHAAGHADTTDQRVMRHLESFLWNPDTLPKFDFWNRSYLTLPPPGKPSQGTNPRFYYACLFGIPSATEFLLSKDLDAEGDDGEYLIAGAMSGNIDVLRLLIDEGALPNHITVAGETALCAAIKAENLPAAEYLLTRGAQVNRGTPPALVCAIKTLSLESVNLCLDAGAEVLDDGSAGLSSVFMSSFLAHGDAGRRIWTALLSRGAAKTFHLQIEDDLGREIPCQETVLKIYAAAQRNCVEYAREVLKADGNIKDAAAETHYINATVQLCIKKDRYQFLEMLLSSLGERFKDYTKALEIACLKGSTSTIAAMLRVRNGRDMGNALLLATATGNVKKVQLLLDNGADVVKKNDSGWTPLLCASVYNHTSILTLFKDKGHEPQSSAEPTTTTTTTTGPTTWHQPSEWVPTHPTIANLLPTLPTDANDATNSGPKGPEITAGTASLSAEFAGQWCTLHSDFPIPYSTTSSPAPYYFEVTVVEASAADIDFHVGLIPVTPVRDPDATFLAAPGSKEGCVGYSSAGALRTWGVEDKTFGSAFAVGDTVGCVVDYKKGTVRFTVNGKRVGTAVGGVKGLLYPVVTVDAGTKISAAFAEGEQKYRTEALKEDAQDEGGEEATSTAAAAGKGHRLDSVLETNDVVDWHERLLENRDLVPL